MIRAFLNWLLNHITERPSDEELIAYGRQLERENQAQQRGYVAVHVDHALRPPAAYEPPSPTTEGKVQVQGARYRAVTRQLREHPGVLMNHERRMREQGERAQRNTDPTTMVPRIRKLNLMLHSEPPPGTTLHSTPAFLL